MRAENRCGGGFNMALAKKKKEAAQKEAEGKQTAEEEK